jgi:hypothetical protein
MWLDLQSLIISEKPDFESLKPPRDEDMFAKIFYRIVKS